MEIKLGGTKGGIALVSQEDYEKLSKYNWHQTATGYARATIDNRLKLMHRIIKNEPKGQVVDHINKNRLDNRQINLRIMTILKNGENKSKAANKSSIYIGITCKKSGRYKNNQKYCATISHDGKSHNLGTFSIIFH